MVRERIIAGGATGSSKTFSLIKIIEHVIAKEPDVHHVIIEVDDGVTRVMDEFQLPYVHWRWDDDASEWKLKGGNEAGARLHVYHCSRFEQVRKAQMEITAKVGRGELNEKSWIGVDGIDFLYNTMRYEAIDKLLAAKTKRRSKMETTEDAWEAALEVRATGATMLEPGDWDMIHSFYESFLSYLMFRISCNIFVTTGLAVIGDNEGDTDLKRFYDALGVKMKFEGQKRTPRVFDTLLAFKGDVSGYYVAIWKDRGRKQEKKLGPDMLLTNNDFYPDIGEKYFGW